MRAPLRFLGWVVYLGLLGVAFTTAGYLAFNRFVHRGVTGVPELVGRQVVEAEAVLADQGLRARRQEGADRFDDEVALDHVLRQTPAAGSLVKRGAAVSIVVSLGPERVAVPDVRGRALQAAQVQLAAAGLSVGRTAAVYAADVTPGSVVEQVPRAGSTVGPATPVDLMLCVEDRARTFVMPDLIYRDYAEARRLLEGRGFRFGSVKFESYEGLAAGLVLRQFPLPGHPLQEQDVISLVVVDS